jgi:DNA helicase-2/ATP-dependent DNA helicase PcrA
MACFISQYAIKYKYINRNDANTQKRERSILMVTAKVEQYTQEQFTEFLAGMKYPPNPFQLKVLESIAFGGGNITVDAKAGSGKTSLLKMIASLLLDMGIEPSEVIFQAFNKSIEEELNAQLPKGFTAKTSHSLGLSMCREYCAAKGIKLGRLSDKKYKDIANYIAERIHPSMEEQDKRFKAMQTVSKMVNFIMANDVDPNDIEAVIDLAYHYALEITPAMITWMPYAIEQAIERFVKFGEMDFIDMIYMPVKLKMEPKFRYYYVLVDEAQDLNSLQQEISAKLLHPEGRVIVVGDVNQSIYAFSGADSQAFYNLQKRFKTQVLALNICYRCPTSHIQVAQSLVPAIEAAPTATEGTIEYKHLDTITSMPLGGMVICRLNAPLVASYFEFIAQEKPAVIIGRDMSKGLIALVDKIADMEGFRYYNINHFIERYYDMEEAKLEKKPNAASKLAQLSDQVACLKVCVENFDCDDLDCFKAKLEALFVDFKDKNLDKSKVVVLCTVHRAKGLEAEHIGLIFQRNVNGDFKDIMPLRWEKQRDWELEQEYNIYYVAVTRSKLILTVFGGYKPSDTPSLNVVRDMPLMLPIDTEKSLEDEEDFEPAPENKVYFGFDDEVDEDYEMEEAQPSAFALAEQADNGQALLELNEQPEETPTLSLEDAAATLYAPIQIADFVEEAAGTPIPPREFFIYGTARPAMYGTCPDDYIKERNLVAAALQNCNQEFYVDMVVYPRKLTREEMKSYEIQPVSENAWDVQIGEQVFTTGRIEFTVMEHLKNGKVVIQVEIDGRKESQIEHQWDLTRAADMETKLAPKPLSLGDLVLLNPELPTDKGWHNRAVKVATMLQDAGLWDGKTPIRFDNAYETHKRVIGFEHLSLDKLVLSEKNGEILVSLPSDSPEGEKLAEAAPVVEQEVIPTDPVAWANWLFENKSRVVILDTETTDMPSNPSNFSVVQLSVINLDGDILFSRYILPYGAKITESAANIHHITNKTLHDNFAASLMAEYDYVKDALEGKHVIAYNSPFDKGALENSFRLIGKEAYSMPAVAGWHCAMRIYTKHNPSKPNRYGKGSTNWKLTEAVAQQGLEVDDNAHDALADVRMTLSLIKSMAADDPNRWKPAKEAAPAEPVYKVDDEVMVKSTKRVAIIKKVMGNGELNLEDNEDGSRMTVRSGMVEPYAKVETPVIPRPETEAAPSIEEQYEVGSMKLAGKYIRLNDGRTGNVLSENGNDLLFLPDGSKVGEPVLRSELMSVISGGDTKDPIQESHEPEASIVEEAREVLVNSAIVPIVEAPSIVIEEATPKQANPYAALESLVKAFGSRKSVNEALELIANMRDELYPENA